MSWFSDVTSWIGNQVNNVTGKNSAMQRQHELNMLATKDQYSNSVRGMQEAGLNPAMMYANSTASSGNSTSQASAASLGSLSSTVNSAANFARAFNNDKNRHNDVSFREVANTVKSLSKIIK